MAGTFSVGGLASNIDTQSIIDSMVKTLKLPEHVTVARDIRTTGNTSAASIPLALDVAVRDGRIKPGDLVMIEAMGGGFTWGAALIRW